MRSDFLLTGLFTGLVILGLQVRAQQLSQYIQPMAGSGAATTPAALKHAKGDALFANTIPAVTTPFAMTQWTPQTQLSEQKCVPPYFYKDTLFSGIRGSHWLSGSCTQDYGSMTVMAISGKLRTKAKDYAAKFSHTDEQSGPSLYSIQLKEYGLEISTAATPRCGMITIRALRPDSVYVLISPNSDFDQGSVSVNRQTGAVSGSNPVHRIYQGWGQEAGFSGHFFVETDRKSTTTGTYADGKIYNDAQISYKKGAGAFLGFKLLEGEVITLKIGTSFSSIQGAEKNLGAEIPGWNFAEVVSRNKSNWEHSLSQVMVSTKSEKDKRIFYTAMYHAMQQPRLYNDMDGTYPKFAAKGQLANTVKGNYYDDFSLWDTYRAHLPLFEILQPALVGDLVSSLIIKGQQGGWLPIFPCWNNYTSEMIGDHCSSVISSACLKGIGDFDRNEAYRLMRQNAFDLPASPAEYVEGKGRRALDSYLSYKYIPLEDEVADAFHKKEQVSRTLEYAYDDFALALTAKKLGKDADYRALISRSKYYVNVFDRASGKVRGRSINGSWISPFNPDAKESYITEGTPRQYTFYVPHDVKGLANLLGGSQNLEKALDTLFAKNEYWHGNEPGHQIPFMYNFTGSPWKSQLAVKEILAKEYGDGPGGLSGNDDAGQMSAWYIFSALGFYPLNPVSGQYLLTAPIFDTASIKVGDHRNLVVKTSKSSPASGFIRAVTWNGKAYQKNFITYDMIKGGGLLTLYLQDEPDKTWGTAPSARPFSLSN